MKKKHYINNSNSKTKININYYVIQLEERVKKKLIKRYDHPLYFHDVKMINDIIYNEKTHFVETFKEYLIYEDLNEFLRRFYNKEEINYKLPKILTFYEKYSKIYANYTVIPESKYMYKNIKRKQKMIDQIQNFNISNSEESDSNNCVNSKIFTTNAMNSINSFTMSIYTNQSFNNNNNDNNINNTNINKNNINLNYNNNKNDSDIKDLVIKIDHFEKQAEMIKRNKINFNINKENKKRQNLICSKGINKIISAIFSPNSKNKLMEKNKNYINKNNNYYNYNNINKNISKKKLSIGDSSKSDRIILSTNVSVSPKFLKEKIFSSPTSRKDIFKKKSNYLSPSISINHSRKNSQQMNKILHNSKGKKIENNNNYNNNNNNNNNTNNNNNNNNNYNTTIFPYKNDNLKHCKGKTFNLNPNQQLNKSNNNIINNYNIVNNFQEGITQINIYTNNDLLKTIKLNNGKSGINNKNIKKQVSHSPNNQSNNTLNNINKKKYLNKDKFDLNLRKIIHNNLIEESALSDRRMLKQNFFDKIGKYFHHNQLSKNDSNVNSKVDINKISINDSKNISKGIIKSPSYKIHNKFNKEQILKNQNLKSQNQSKCLSPNNSNFSTITVRKIGSNNINLGDKYKLKNIQNFNKFKNNNGDLLIHSDRNKKSNIIFK